MTPSQRAEFVQEHCTCPTDVDLETREVFVVEIDESLCAVHTPAEAPDELIVILIDDFDPAVFLDAATTLDAKRAA